MARERARERGSLNVSAAAEIEAALVETFPEGGVYAVGGSVRDAVLTELGRAQPNQPDLDYLVTGIRLEDLLRRLAVAGRAELVGASFGVVKFTRGPVTVDVALPRRERSTGPHHREFVVESSPEIPLEEDLSRRDFRVNMLARDVRTGEIIDPHGGRADLEFRRLDALREAAFEEDPLRILRGAQFAARFELQATPATLAAMRAAAELVPTVAPERITDELVKLLTLAPQPSVGLELLRDTGALVYIMPELLEGWQVEQNQYHAYTVYYHSLRTVDEAPADLTVRLAALLHDIGKPRTKEGPHFYGHQGVGEKMARSMLERLRFPGEVIDRVCKLILNHMYSTADVITDAGIRRFIRRVEPANLDSLFALRQADIRASGIPPHDEGENERFETRVAATIKAGHALTINDLKITGQDVIQLMRELGLVGEDFQGDKRVGAALRMCLEEVLDEPSRNEPETLRGLVRSFFNRPPKGV